MNLKSAYILKCILNTIKFEKNYFALFLGSENSVLLAKKSGNFGYSHETVTGKVSFSLRIHFIRFNPSMSTLCQLYRGDFTGMSTI